MGMYLCVCDSVRIRITVMSSLYEISTDQLGNRVLAYVTVNMELGNFF
jgi:hypothetical protein